MITSYTIRIEAGESVGDVNVNENTTCRGEKKYGLRQ